MTSRPRPTTTLATIALLAAIAQALAPVIANLSGGASPGESTTDLFITPAGYTFSIWGVIYALSIATAACVLWKRSTGTDSPDRLLTDLLIAFVGASVWIAASAAEIPWVTPVVLTVMTVALLDAALLAARSCDTSAPGWLTGLTRATVGMYAAWATAAVFQNWASDIGASFGDPTVLWWQAAILILGACVGIAVTARFGAALPLYPVTLVWALLGILVTAWSETPMVVGICLAAMVAVVGAWWLSRRRGMHVAAPLPSSTYSAPGGLRQDPGSPAE